MPRPEDSLYLKHVGFTPGDPQLLQTLKVQGQKAKTPMVKAVPLHTSFLVSRPWLTV